MRRNRKTKTASRRNRLSVSLFPFLAVLICTLGILIMMLVMAVKAADDQVRQSQSESDTKQLAKIAELESVRDVRMAQIEGLGMVRPEALIRLEESRANRSHIEEQIRKLKMEARNIGEELIELDRESKRIAQLKDPDAPSVPVLPEFPQADKSKEMEHEALLQQLKSEIARAEDQLKLKRESTRTSGPSRYVIVPHKGGGGTFRRPIFMECTSDAIILRPSGIRLAKSEFVPPLEPGNMLDSALLTIREYWSRYDLAGEEGRPYPLIVVRPGGAETFALARLAMKSWDDEFGYELVESETPLEFGVKDEQLETEVQEAIREARSRQRQRLASARYRQSGRGHSGAGASGRIGDRRSGRSQRDARPGLMADGRGGFVSNAARFEDEASNVEYSENGNFAGGHSSEGQAESFVSAASGMSDETTANDFESQSAQLESAGTQHQGSSVQDAGQQATQSTEQADTSFASNSNGTQAGDPRLQNPYADDALAKERGRDWALPTQTPGATGYVRPIRVVCHPKALEIFAGQTSKRIPMTGDTGDAIDPLVDAIWAQIDNWGIPGANAYWKPQLRFRIPDGGQQRYLELKGLLYKSGLTLTANHPSEQQQ